MTQVLQLHAFKKHNNYLHDCSNNMLLKNHDSHNFFSENLYKICLEQNYSGVDIKWILNTCIKKKISKIYFTHLIIKVK